MLATSDAPVRASAESAPESAAIARRHAMRMLRRGKRSATCPATSERPAIGTNWARPTKARDIGLPVAA